MHSMFGLRLALGTLVTVCMLVLALVAESGAARAAGAIGTAAGVAQVAAALWYRRRDRPHPGRDAE